MVATTRAAQLVDISPTTRREPVFQHTMNAEPMRLAIAIHEAQLLRLEAYIGAAHAYQLSEPTRFFFVIKLVCRHVVSPSSRDT